MTRHVQVVGVRHQRGRIGHPPGSDDREVACQLHHRSPARRAITKITTSTTITKVVIVIVVIFVIGHRPWHYASRRI
jgi:hypothetical protein